MSDLSSFMFISDPADSVGIHNKFGYFLIIKNSLNFPFESIHEARTNEAKICVSHGGHKIQRLLAYYNSPPLNLVEIHHRRSSPFPPALTQLFLKANVMQ